MIDKKGNEYEVDNYDRYRRIQLVELELIKEFERICKRYSLNFYMCGGTLLGAVRHSGFIPWDDDLDIYMPRKDYDIFRKVVDKELDSRIFYQDWHKEKEYPYNFSKLRMNNTIFLQEEICQCNINHGIFIDIFPLDNVPNSKILRFMHLKKITLIKSLLSITYMTYDKYGKKRPMYQRAIIKIVKFLFNSNYLHESLEKNILKYNSFKGEYLCQKTGINALKEVYPKVWFDEKVKLDFEGLKLPAPKYYHEYLAYFYGDYMTIPPREERRQTHPIKKLEFNNL